MRTKGILIVVSLGMFLLLSFLPTTQFCLASQWLTLIPEELPINYGFIQSDGEINPPSLPIQRSGNTYFLKDDILNYSIAIQKQGVVIDGNNFTLSIPKYGEKDKNQNVKTVPALFEIVNIHNITIKNTQFQNAKRAIQITNSSQITIKKNSIKSGHAVGVINSSYVYISQNSLTSEIGIVYSENCIIFQNFCNGTNTGLYSRGSSFELKHNTFIKSGGYIHGANGITGEVFNCSIIGNIFYGYNFAFYFIGHSNLIIGNTFENNAIGIYQVMTPQNLLEKNEMHHNNFINNDQHLSLGKGIHIINNGKEGNFYSDYDGKDTNQDGIGDTPYETSYIVSSIFSYDDTTIDNFPLMEPVDIETIPEFPSMIFVPMLLVFVPVGIIIRIRLMRRTNEEI